MMVKDYVALDLETSGLNPSEDKIIEIGMIKVINGEVADSYHRLVNPGEHLSQRIVELTGITDEMVEAEDRISDIIANVIDFIGELPLLGHNIIFDYSFLKKAAVNEGISFEKKGFCTLKLARRLLPDVPHKNLEYLCDYFSIDAGSSHRALDDAKSAIELFKRLYELDNEDTGFEIPEMLNFSVKKDTPVTDAQIRYLMALVNYHGLKTNIDVNNLTKSKASKLIDSIISEYGKIPAKK